MPYKLSNKVHAWIILGMMVVGAAFYYHNFIPGFHQVVEQLPIIRYRDFLRVLNLVPIIYVTYIFGFRGGLLITVITTLSVLPDAVLEALEGLGEHAIAEVLGVAALGLGITWLVDRLQTSRKRLEETQQELETALENLRHHAHQLEAEKRRLEAIHIVNYTVTQYLETEKVLNYALDKTLETTGLELGAIFLLEDKTRLALKAHRGFSPQLAAEMQLVSLGQSFSRGVVQSGEPLVIPDYTAAEGGIPILKKEGVRFTSIVPIRAAGTIIGVFCVGTRSTQKLEPQDVSMMETIALDIGTTVKNSLLYAQLQEHEEEHRTLIEEAGDAIFILEPSTGHVLDANSKAAELTGYEKAELCEKTILELAHPEGREKASLAFEEAVQKGHGVFPDIPGLRKNGSRVDVEVVARTISLRGRTVIMAIVRDISLRKQMEDTIHRLAENERIAKETALNLVRHTNEEKNRLQDTILEKLTDMVSYWEARMPATVGHSEKVRRYAKSIARSMNLSENEIAVIERAARLHALGLYALQDPSFHLTSPMSWPPSPADERNIKLVLERTLDGIEPLGFLGKEAAIIRAMVETYDGRGLPERLRGENIPLGARIFAIAHAFDILTREGLAKRVLSPSEALMEMGKHAGTLFDPKVLDALEVTYESAQAEIDEGI